MAVTKWSSAAKWRWFSVMMLGSMIEWGAIYIFLVPLLTRFGASPVVASFAWCGRFTHVSSCAALI